MAHELIRVANEADWQSYHAIRRTALWEERGLSGYDETRAEERLPNHHPLLLMFNGRGIGTTRLDELRDDTGIVRLVAIVASARGHGHGRVLNAKVEEFARQLGIRVLLVNAAADAEGFYTAMGWRRLEGHPPLTLGRAANCVPMRKAILAL